MELPSQMPEGMDKKGVVELGVTPSEQSCKPAAKIEKDQPLASEEKVGKDYVKEASTLFNK